MPHHQGGADALPPLGPFRLRYPVAAGAAGEVWRGDHPPTGVGVAVKVLRARADPATFLAEVRLLAALRHPNVVRLLDAGLVDAAAASASGGRLPEGAPWLATEFAGGGSLADAAVTDWDTARRVVSCVLAGLASAHAHGIVHRDVKPHNVLLASPFSELGRPPGSLAEARVLLADFGIGTRLGDRGAARAGTPAYAAPEQLRGAWRDEGPWTDT
jgi:serine/threonine protein kinase